MTSDGMDDTNPHMIGCKSSLTLTVIAGLGQGLAVGQHGHFRHGHTHHRAFFISFVLNREGTNQGSGFIVKRFCGQCGQKPLTSERLSYFYISWVSVGGGDVWLPVFGRLGQVF